VVGLGRLRRIRFVAAAVVLVLLIAVSVLFVNRLSSLP
jgi:hypothetical protein